MYALGRDIVAELGTAAFALASTNLVAGGAGDNAAIDGTVIDLASLPSRAESIAFLVGARAALGAGNTLKVSARILTSETGVGDWREVAAPAEILELTGGAGGTTEDGTGKIGIPLEYCEQYIRVVPTPDLSAADTDTATVFGLAVFGGLARLP